MFTTPIEAFCARSSVATGGVEGSNDTFRTGPGFSVQLVADKGLRDLLLQVTPSAREKLPTVLILDQPDRDAIASELLRYGDANGIGWADVIDMLTLHPDTRRKVVSC
jgi:hypothetical protein